MDEIDPGAVEECRKVVMSLKSCGINFLALDFDLTLISEHTGGHWRGTVPDLALKVRPFFRILVPMVIENGIAVSIVTFSGQIQIISAVLQSEFPAVASRIVIRGADKSWEYRGSGSREGKQAHMASAAEELIAATGLTITRNSTLLVDDDANNIRIALANKVRAIRFFPDTPRR